MVVQKHGPMYGRLWADNCIFKSLSASNILGLFERQRAWNAKKPHRLLMGPPHTHIYIKPVRSCCCMSQFQHSKRKKEKGLTESKMNKLTTPHVCQCACMGKGTATDSAEKLRLGHTTLKAPQQIASSGWWSAGCLHECARTHPRKICTHCTRNPST